MPPKAKSKAGAKAKAKAKSVAKGLAEKKERETTQLIDKTDGDEMGDSKRKLRRRDSDQQIKKIVYDNFRGWSDEEIYLREVNGSALYDRLRIDRRKWKSGEIEMGNKYYRELRVEFANPDAVEGRLKPTNPDDKQDDQLLAALTAMVTAKSHVNEFLDWAENVKNVNNFNLIAVYRQLLAMPPGRNVEYLTVSLAAMKMIKRLQLHETFPEPWALMRDHFDQCLVASVSQFKCQGRPVTFWWKAHRASASLVLPELSVDAAMAVQDKWVTVTEHVEAVWNSSAIGRALMDKAMRQVNLEKMSSVIDGFVRKMDTSGVAVSVAMLSASREELLQEMQRRCTDATKAFDTPKEIECMYRGVPIRLICTSPLDQYNIRVAAWIRGLAVDEELLIPLWCESELIAGARAKTGRMVDDAVLTEAKNFRESAHDLLSVVEATGPNIEDVIKRKASFLQSVDRCCRLELAFWSSSIGDKAKMRVQASIKACLPSVGRPMVLSTSLQALDKLGESKLMVFAGAGMQSMFKSVQGFVSSLKVGASPALDKAGDSAFMLSVKECLALFLTFDSRAAGASAGSADVVTVMYGEQAAKGRFAELAEVWGKNRDAVAYANVAILQAFNWLLGPAEQADLRKIGSAIVAKKSGDVSGGPAAKKSKKGAVAPVDAKDLVAALFQR
jgi:hypothetical protein